MVKSKEISIRITLFGTYKSQHTTAEQTFDSWCDVAHTEGSHAIQQNTF